MLSKLRILIFVCLSFVLVSAIGYPAEASEQMQSQKKPTEPTLINAFEDYSTLGKGGNGNNEIPGEWYAGETPLNLLHDAPVLLFVPGLNNTAQIFWEDNDMYQTAYNAGYQTAFVQLYDAGGESADMWDNGELLADKIREISDYFDGKQITLVAYSKGGVDSQTALTYYGAWENVDNVITLSSPHHGSQLADLAYSFWAGWLADLIGMQGEGTYSMETGYMESYRSEIDDQPKAYYNDYYTLGGTSWGPAFSSTWFGGMYLSSYGDSDGVVTTASSNLLGGHELAIGDWSHTSVRSGLTFEVFQPYLHGDDLTNIYHFPRQINQQNRQIPALDQWVYGGPLASGDKDKIAISVEDDVEKLTVQMMTATHPSTIKVTDPNGKIVNTNVNSIKEDEGIFSGAIINLITLNKPMAGDWSLEIESKEEDAYLLVADYEMNSKLKLYSNESNQLNENGKYTYNLVINANEVQGKSLRATYHVTESGNPDKAKVWTVHGNANLSQELKFDKMDQVYNITINVEGVTKAGYSFKRTIVDSVYSGK